MVTELGIQQQVGFLFAASPYVHFFFYSSSYPSNKKMQIKYLA